MSKKSQKMKLLNITKFNAMVAVLPQSEEFVTNVQFAKILIIVPNVKKTWDMIIHS